MTFDEQLDLWVAGSSVHLDDEGGGWCCPDFSCCQPALLAPQEVREAFKAADEDTRMGMLGHFLAEAFCFSAKVRLRAKRLYRRRGPKPKPGQRVYVVGQGAEH